MPALEDVRLGLRLLWALQQLRQRPPTRAESETTLRQRLGRRPADFVVRLQRIHAQPASPYRALLVAAGCEAGDLAALVGQDGVEGALHTLYRRGVYLTVDEFKGRAPVVRGSTTLHVAPGAFVNRDAAGDARMQSSGSRGARHASPIDLAYVRDLGVDRILIHAAQGADDWVRAVWQVPGGTALFKVLRYAALDIPLARWYSQVDPVATGLAPRYRWSDRALRLGGLLAGRRFPAPEYAPVDAPLPIARWMAQCLAAGQTPHLGTYPSGAVRVCEAATAAGLDLVGAQFEVSGEPLTEARLTAIRRSGAGVSAVYGSDEAASVAFSFLDPTIADDMHLLTDLHAIIQPGPGLDDPRLPPAALLVTALRPTAPYVLLNTSLGDQAVLGPRACGCPLETLGWTTHLHGLRSFEKLTAGGMTFLDTDVIHVLERQLPARLGGGPGDYQLVDEELPDGRPGVRLLAHPRLGPLDAAEVRRVFLAEIGRGSGVERLMGQVWSDAGLPVVERAAPYIAESGKVQHVHRLQRMPPPIPPGEGAPA